MRESLPKVQHFEETLNHKLDDLKTSYSLGFYGRSVVTIKVSEQREFIKPGCSICKIELSFSHH